MYQKKKFKNSFKLFVSIKFQFCQHILFLTETNNNSLSRKLQTMHAKYIVIYGTEI